MAGLKRRGHDQGIRDAVSRGARLLGICLGMQLLFDESEEFGCCQGLGLIPGRVTRIPPVGVKVPHVGWNRLQPLPGRSWTGTPLALIPPGTWAYFVHSFRVEVSDEANLLAVAQYGPHHVTAAVGRGSVHGFQFHPEKSGRAGLDMLQAFCSQKD
jgi:glutamine amidotransferase